MLQRWLNKTEVIGCHFGGGRVRLAQVLGLGSRRPRAVVAERELPPLGTDDPGFAAAVSDLLRKMRRSAPFRGSRVASCLPPRAVKCKTMRIAPMPANELAQAAHWKAATELGMKPDTFKSAILNFGTIQEGTRQKTEALVLGATLEELDRHVAMLAAAGLRPVAIDASVCAVARCLGVSQLAAEAAHGQRIVLELREDQAFLAIATGADLDFVRPVGDGLAQLIQMLADVLEVTPGEAQAMYTAALAVSPGTEPGNWPFPHPFARVREAVADASRMYGRELARQVALSIHYYATTFSTTPPDTGIVFSDYAIDPAALEAVTVQSGIDLTTFKPADNGLWTDLAAAGADDAAAWVTAMGLSRYEHGLSSAKEVA